MLDPAPRASSTAGCARRPGTASLRHVLVVQRWDVCGGRAHSHGVVVPSSVTTTLGTQSVHRPQRTQAPNSRWRAKLHPRWWWTTGMLYVNNYFQGMIVNILQ